MRFLFFSTTPGVPGKAGDGISDGGMIKHHSTLNRSFDQSVCYNNIQNYSLSFILYLLNNYYSCHAILMLYSKRFFRGKMLQMMLNKDILLYCLGSIMSKKS